jgi:phosphoribosyl-ATP pyrophosphohydrolase
VQAEAANELRVPRIGVQRFECPVGSDLRQLSAPPPIRLLERCKRPIGISEIREDDREIVWIGFAAFDALFDPAQKRHCCSLLITVEPNGPACHNGTTSCFADAPPLPLEQLMSVLRDRHEKRPPGSYTAKLFEGGLDRILKKVGEEATEVVIAAKGEPRERLINEITDLVFHLSVLMTNERIGWDEIQAELTKRRTMASPIAPHTFEHS